MPPTLIFRSENSNISFIDPRTNRLHEGICCGMVLEWARNIITTNAAMDGNSTQPDPGQALLTHRRFMEDPSADLGHQRSEVTGLPFQELRSVTEVAQYLARPDQQDARPHTLSLIDRAAHKSHMIGLLKKSPYYYCFDPNQGMCRCDSVQELSVVVDKLVQGYFDPTHQLNFRLSEIKTELRLADAPPIARLPTVSLPQPTQADSSRATVRRHHPYAHAYVLHNAQEGSAQSRSQQQSTNALPQGSHASSGPSHRSDVPGSPSEIAQPHQQQIEPSQPVFLYPLSLPLPPQPGPVTARQLANAPPPQPRIEIHPLIAASSPPPPPAFHPHAQAFAPDNPHAFSAMSQQQQHTNAPPGCGHAGEPLTRHRQMADRATTPGSAPAGSHVNSSRRPGRGRSGAGS